jgi:hypothetical protein
MWAGTTTTTATGYSSDSPYSAAVFHGPVSGIVVTIRRLRSSSRAGSADGASDGSQESRSGCIAAHSQLELIFTVLHELSSLLETESVC